MPEDINIRQKAFAGLGWTIAAQVSKQGLQFPISVILARLLSPEEFGMMGMIIVFTDFAALFGDMGFDGAIIQRKEIEERHLSSVFWLTMLMGLVLTFIVLLAAPGIAAFYNQPALKNLSMLLSANFIIRSLCIVQKAILSRKMEFRLIALVEVLTVLLAGVTAITLAYLGYGVFSLVCQSLAASAVTATILWWTSDWRPRYVLNKGAVKEITGFSSNLLGYNIFNYWARNSDNLLIGRFIGTVGLGIYTRAYMTMLLPLSQFSWVFTKVMFPTFSRIQHDISRVKQIYLKCLGTIALITFPMMIGLAVVADNFVIAVFGEKWSMMVPALQVLSIVGALQSIVTTVGWIYMSQGKTDWMFKWGLFSGSVAFASFSTGVYIGSVEAVAYCYALANLLLLYWNFTIPGRLIGMTLSDVLKTVSGISCCTMLMAVTVWGVGFYLSSHWHHWLRLSIQVLLGSSTYFFLAHSFRLKAYQELLCLLREQLTTRFGRSTASDHLSA